MSSADMKAAKELLDRASPGERDKLKALAIGLALIRDPKLLEKLFPSTPTASAAAKADRTAQP